MLHEIVVNVEEEYVGSVDAQALEAVAAAVLAHEGVDAAALSIVITHDEVIQRFNLDYRGLDAPTDVLSFAAQEGDEPLLDLPVELADALDKELGDVVIALPYARRQAEQFGNTLDAELKLLVAHGVLHLLGYDHDSPEAEAALWALQEEILAGFGVAGLSHRTYEE